MTRYQDKLREGTAIKPLNLVRILILRIFFFSCIFILFNLILLALGEPILGFLLFDTIALSSFSYMGSVAGDKIDNLVLKVALRTYRRLLETGHLSEDWQYQNR